MGSNPRHVAALMIGSGFSALVYQTAWQREFRLTFGASTAASAAVLGIFLGGLGIGSWLLGTRAERSDRPLRMYGNLEVLISLLAVASPFLLDAGTLAYDGAGGSASLGLARATLLRLGICSAVIGPPVVLMGGTLPAAARAIEEDADASRRRVATLYAANTAGAVLGALAGTLVLFEVLGTRLTLSSAALVNLLVGVCARSLGRDAVVPRARRGGQRGPRSSAYAPKFVYTVAGAVGFVFLLMELVWYRMLAPLLGGSTFSFGLVLGIALAGVGLGGYAFSRAEGCSRPSLTFLALSLAVEALAISAPLWLGDRIAMLTVLTRPGPAYGFAGLALSWVFVCGLVVLPTALVAGYQFPLLIALLGRGRAQVARQIGVAYFFNTLGAIAGALLGGFVLIPELGVLATWRACAAILLVCSVGALAVSRWRAPRLAAATGMISLVAVGATTARGPTAVWRHTPIGVGHVSLRNRSENERRAWQHEVRAMLLWERDGVEAAVGLIARDDLAFAVNGKLDGTSLTDRGTQAMLGVLPALLHPEPERVFVVGLGTGMTAGWLSVVSGVESVRVAELEPAVVEVADAMRLANHDVLHSKKVEIVPGDGRELLSTDDSRYDLIISEPSNPYRAGVAALFTVDFYEAAKERLEEGGLFAQWMQGYDIDTTTLLVVLKTLASVFPHVEAWTPSSMDFVFVASERPLVHDVGRLQSAVRAPQVRDALRRTWLVEDVPGILSHFLATDALIDRLTTDPSVPLNTDDRNVLEYAFARSVEHSHGGRVFELMVAAERAGQHLPPTVGSVDRARTLELRHRIWNVSGAPAPDQLVYADAQSARRALAVQAGCLGAPQKALERRAASDGTPRDAVEVFAVAQALAHAGRKEALQMASHLEEEGFVPEAHLTRARFNEAAHLHGAAVEALEACYVALRLVGLPLCETARQAIAFAPTVTHDAKDAARLARALHFAPFAVHGRDQERIEMAQELGYRSRNPALCIETMGRNLELPWWTEQFLERRAECTRRARHELADRAEQDLRDFRAAVK